MKKVKHFFSKIGYLFNHRLFSIFRYILLLKRIPNLSKPSTISEFLLKRKIENSFVRPELSGKIEGHEFAKHLIGEKNCIEKKYFITLQDDINHTVQKLLENIQSGECLIMKPNHSCAQYLLLDNSILSIWTEQKLVKLINYWLKYDYSDISGENIYRNAKRGILVEKAISGKMIASDIKIHCFHGQPKVIQFMDRTEVKLKRQTFKIDHDQITPVQYYRNEVLSHDHSKMHFLKDIIKHSATLSRDFDYVRVDFIYNANQYYFAELTFLPAGGCMPLLNCEVDKTYFSYLAA